MATTIPELDPITRGDDETLNGQVFQYDGGPVRDITNDTLKFTVKQSETESSFVLQKTSSAGAGITKTNPSQGLYTIAISRTDFASLTHAKTGEDAYYCDVELTDTAGRKTTIGKYRLPVELDITTN